MNQHKYPYFELKAVDTQPAAETVVAPQFTLRHVPAETDVELKIIPVQVVPGSDQKFFLFGEGIIPQNKEE
ncbi:hypothetical protein THIOM_004438 [Candidatus Thiomargarita nelsonii]|uniref:Uncharacterized protein n=1 Tax=Candidatus Thiomargarita nelsonii TaxID=1003181 RepID=A0A176RW14_9GAMM|nr:hypothetical protein THIOM_004438 [Candidatus Thiomargarita nelsonii]